MKHHRHLRNSSGIYLIETLVALIFGTLIAFALFQTFAQTLRVTSTNLNTQSACLMTQTVLDSFKALPYAKFSANLYTLLPWSTTAGETESTIHPMPAGINMGDLNWANTVNTNKFPGTISLVLAQGPDSNSQTATTTIKWADSGATAGKSVSTLTVVHQRGLNYWPSP